MEKYQRLSFDEREMIGQLLSQGKSLRFIAETLGRNVSTISPDVGHFTSRGNRYKPWLAHYCADNLSVRHNCNRRIASNPKLHWEGDLLIGKDHKSALGSNVERTTRTVILVPLKERDAVSVRKAFAKELKTLPGQMALSMTYDRGKEMAAHKCLPKKQRCMSSFVTLIAHGNEGQMKTPTC